MKTVTFRPYCTNDFQACINIFNSNCPEYLAPGERRDYVEFLNGPPQNYEVCELDGQMAGVFGVSENSLRETRLCWIMVNSGQQNTGIGNKIMQRVLHLGRTSQATTIGLSTSQKVAPFFEKYGATTLSITKDGYGAGLDCVAMVLPL